MEKQNSRRKVILFILTVLSGLTACSLDAKKGPSLLLRFDPTDQRESHLPMHWFQSDVSTRVAPTMNQFACIGVNVTGSGINDSSVLDPNTPAESQAIYQSLVAGNTCSYRGVVGGVTMRPVGGNFGPMDVSIPIPAGAGRMIQVFGVGDIQGTGANTTTICNSALQDDGSNISGQKAIYELARAPLPSIFSSQSITLSSNLAEAAWSDPDNKLMDCDEQTLACTVVGSYTTAPDGTEVVSAVATIRKIGIPITVTTPFTPDALELKIKLTGNGSGPSVVTAAIFSDMGSSPNAQIGNPVTVTVPAVANAVEFTFSMDASTLVQATNYWVVITPDTAGIVLPKTIAGSVGAKANISGWSALVGAPNFQIKICEGP